MWDSRAQKSRRFFEEKIWPGTGGGTRFQREDAFVMARDIPLEWARRPLLQGCTGFGCGAAFNFVALLPDGEVHAWRKFPSRVGHVRETKLRAIYDSPAAVMYRKRPVACRKCALRNACGGCLAVSYRHGFNPLLDRDPYCFV